MHTPETLIVPDFEIDHPEKYSQFFLRTPREIAFYLLLLSQRRILVSAHIDDGQRFFLTTIAGVEPDDQLLLIDPAQDNELNAAACSAKKITLVANLDRVRIEIRLSRLKLRQMRDEQLLAAPLPDTMLRLQRREFFRLEPPASQPLYCALVFDSIHGGNRNHQLKVADISGGGLGLYAPIEMLDDCLPGTLFTNCRLEIPGESVILVSLRARKAVEVSSNTERQHLRLGCEYVGLSSARLSMIERYITRVERERKARESGLAD